MKKICITILILIAAKSVFSQTKNNISNAKVSFEIKNLGIRTGGTIGGVQGNIAFDPAVLATSKIEATADVNTINTDNSMRDEHLKKDDFFDVAKYPAISLSSVSFKKKGGNSFTGQFNITLKGKTKLVEVSFSYADNLFKGSFKINRKDFAIGGSSMTMGDEVIINFEAATTK